LPPELTVTPRAAATTLAVMAAESVAMSDTPPPALAATSALLMIARTWLSVVLMADAPAPVRPT